MIKICTPQNKNPKKKKKDLIISYNDMIYVDKPQPYFWYARYTSISYFLRSISFFERELEVLLIKIPKYYILNMVII